MATQLNLTEDQKAEVEQFRTDVVEPSMTKLVILDFWAEWCGPCKQLTPVLEKVAADYADKGVVLKKVNVDEQKFIAAQFQVQSIPAVYAMFQGQPVADLGSARSEGQLKQALDQILQQLPVEPGADDGGKPDNSAEIAQYVEMAENVLADGDHERALGIFSQVLEMAPTDTKVISGFARTLIAMGKIDEARQMLGQVPEDMQSDPDIVRAQAALDLVGSGAADEDIGPLEEKVSANPDDHEARLELANAQIAKGNRDAAADNLFHIIEADREWNDGAARERLLKLFEVVGLEDPWVSQQRRRLSAILFG
ncbi:MAG: tetratricopeptide repeat protein [Parasphingopyxis sp.]|uniref:tetratricopeptide repeat protein n=1 Tax=Parasphingopyxis sp. TaxID=1920299 RepID=UPI0032EE9246